MLHLHSADAVWEVEELSQGGQEAYLRGALLPVTLTRRSVGEAFWVRVSKAWRVVLLVAVVLALAGWQLFYTDKRATTGPVERPFGWLDAETLLTSEGGSLYLRRGGGERELLFAAEGTGAEFTGPACLARDRWWLGSVTRTEADGAVTLSNDGPVLFEVQRETSGDVSAVKPVAQARFSSPVPMTCEKDLAAAAALDFLRTQGTYQENGTVLIDGERYLLRLPSSSHGGDRGSVAMTSAPEGGQIYLHDQPRGLTVLAGDRLSVHLFPAEMAEAMGASRGAAWGYLLWDRAKQQALFVQNSCVAEGGKSCTRKAIWLSPSLEASEMVELPSEPLIEIKAGYSCFSCGCGCYSHQALVAEGGEIHAHVWGYPVKNARRGIYRLAQTETGPIWEKIVSGRPQPPLAFSPDGRKVAYFELSRLGDRFKIADIARPAK